MSAESIKVSRERLPSTVVWVGLGVATGWIAISNQSYWIDEISTAHKAMMPTLEGWWGRMRAEGTSNLQLPLYLLYAWGWARLFGYSEFALRAGNLVWWLTALTVVSLLWRTHRRFCALLAVTLMTNAFAWYYLNEARPYAMQIGTSFLVCGSLYGLLRGDLAAPQERWWAGAGGLGLVLLSASGLLAMYWLGALLLAVALGADRRALKRLLWQYRGQWSATLLFLIGIALYYVWTVQLGADVSHVGTTDWRNPMFIIYELFGLAGTGPGRIELRQQGLRSLLPYAVPLAVQGGLLATVCYFGLRRVFDSRFRRIAILTALCVGGAALFLFVFGGLTRFRVLGRHVTPLLPLVLLIVALGLDALWARPARAGRLIVIACLMFNLWSSICVRFCDRHARDDYRAAAGFAKSGLGNGETVWWDADPQATLVYGVRASNPPAKPGHAVLLFNPTGELLSSLSVPDLVIASKPDVYDAHGALRAFVSTHGYIPISSPQAFTIWSRRR
jgi:hypothetical protein